MRRRHHRTLCAATLLLAACAGARVPAPDYAPRAVVELGRWPVDQEGRMLGWLVLLEIRDPAGPLRFFRVENRRGQWVGHATVQGRFSRRVPFRDDEEDLGLYPMLRGVARLLDADGAIAIAGRSDAAAAEAAARRQERP